MINSYLVEVVKVLQPTEQQDFIQFLTSSQTNRSGSVKEMVSLFQIILEAGPQFSGTSLNKDIIYFKIFSNQNIVSGKLEKLMADLNKALREYALVKRYFSEKNEEQQQIDWAAWLRERGIAERAHQVITKLKSGKERQQEESLEFHRSCWLIAEEEHEWASLHNKVKGDINIPNVIYHLDLYYFIYRSELENRYFLQQRGAQLPDLDLIEAGFDYYKNKSTLLQITKTINEILRKGGPTLEEFLNLLQLLQSNVTTLSFQSRVQCYAYLRNFCILLINQGKFELFQTLHDIHKHNLDQGYFFVHGEISPNSFISLIQTATRVKDFSWTIDFIKNHQKKLLGGDEGQYYYRMGMAQCYFAENKFEQASNIIPETPSSFYYHHMVRILELKIFYELRSELLPYKIDAFRKYIERTAAKSLAAQLREMYLNFLKILLQLSQSSLKDKARSARLIERIKEKKLLADRAWLLEKAKELG